MDLQLTGAGTGEQSRIAGIRMVLLTLRMMEHWRKAAGDYNSAMVLLAVVAVSGEKLTRAELEGELRDLKTPIDRSALAPCNISSIAAATGFNRETARRYVNRLVDDGVLIRTPDGSVRIVEGYVQRASTTELIAMQLEAFTRTANDLLKAGVLRLSAKETPFEH